LTNVYKLDKTRLYVTYFEGDQRNGLEPDLEARQYWLDVGVAESHVIPGNAKDNFWGTKCLAFIAAWFLNELQRWVQPVLAAHQGTARDLSDRGPF
jgi:hypothetical protein